MGLVWWLQPPPHRRNTWSPGKSRDSREMQSPDRSNQYGVMLALGHANPCSSHVAGWYVDRSSNFSIRAYCREHASRGLPLPYSSDSQSDDLPYWVPSPIKDEPEAGRDEGLLMIPVSQDCSDMRFNVRGAGWAGPDDFFKHLVSDDASRCSTPTPPRPRGDVLWKAPLTPSQRDAFDILYYEGEEGEPKMMTVILHPPIIGRAGRTASLEKFLAYSESNRVQSPQSTVHSLQSTVHSPAPTRSNEWKRNPAGSLTLAAPL